MISLSNDLICNKSSMHYCLGYGHSWCLVSCACTCMVVCLPPFPLTRYMDSKSTFPLVGYVEPRRALLELASVEVKSGNGELGQCAKSCNS